MKPIGTTGRFLCRDERACVAMEDRLHDAPYATYLRSSSLPAVRREKVTFDFDGDNQSSDAGLLLRAAEQKVGFVARLATALRVKRDPTRIRHALCETIGARIFAISSGLAVFTRPASSYQQLRHPGQAAERRYSAPVDHSYPVRSGRG